MGSVRWDPDLLVNDPDLKEDPDPITRSSLGSDSQFQVKIVRNFIHFVSSYLILSLFLQKT